MLSKKELQTHAGGEITIELTDEQVAERWDMLQLLKDRMDDLVADTKQSMIDWIDKHGDLVIGDIRYYVAPRKTKVCTDRVGTLAALIQSTGGSIEDIDDVLVAQPFKPVACAQALSEQDWNALFQVRIDKDLKSGKPRKSLQSMPKFLKGGL